MPKRAAPMEASGAPAKKGRVPRWDKDKSLRHLSLQVCHKVSEKGHTSYNEVADELVADLAALEPGGAHPDGKQKNIRRRVYDALNVLEGIGMIQREKKQISWVGLKGIGESDEAASLAEEVQARKLAISEKASSLQELSLHLAGQKRLLNHNATQVGARVDKMIGSNSDNEDKDDTEDKEGKAGEDDEAGAAAGTSAPDSVTVQSVGIPFLMVKSSKDCHINCEMSDDRKQMKMNFSNSFELIDDNVLLQEMGMQDVGKETLSKLAELPMEVVDELPRFNGREPPAAPPGVGSTPAKGDDPNQIKSPERECATPYGPMKALFNAIETPIRSPPGAIMIPAGGSNGTGGGGRARKRMLENGGATATAVGGTGSSAVSGVVGGGADGQNPLLFFTRLLTSPVNRPSSAQSDEGARTKPVKPAPRMGKRTLSAPGQLGGAAGAPPPAATTSTTAASASQ